MSKYNLILEDKRLFKDYFLNDEIEPISYIPKFNVINIIVGANNSGKSRFIRNLMSFDKFIGIDYNDFLKYNIMVNSNNQYNNAGINLSLLLLSEDISEKMKSNMDLMSMRFGSGNEKTLYFETNFKDIRHEFTRFKRIFVPAFRTAHSLFQITKLGSEKSIDVPGTNDYKKIEDDIYLHTYLKNYKIDKSVEIFTGLHLYREILNARNSKREKRLKFEKFQDFIGDNFFDKKKIDIVAEIKKEDYLNGKNDNEIISIDIEGEVETRDLHDLGDGIQALIVLMYKIFMAENNSFIFIDEPELNLHPGMQRLFLEQIYSNEALKKKNLIYIITTHSNHFLDLTIEKNDVSIYSFSQKNTKNGEKQFIIKNVNAGDNQILKNLGVNNSSVFMANCSIWVEGISDRNYIKAFLKSYSENILKNDKKNYINLKEDIDFAFFEYAGSNIDHYFFENDIEKIDGDIVINDIKALALSNRIFLLADSDATTISNKSKYKRLKTLENSSSDNFTPKIIWNFREIENLLTNDVWGKILICFCNENLLKDNSIEIQKKINEALQSVDYTKFKKKYVGEFLDKIREQIGKIGRVHILNKSLYETKKDKTLGTIINKRKLSELVLEKNFAWDILSKNQEIEKLTIEIYNFILGKKPS